MVLYGEPEDPAVARKRARMAGEGAGAAELNVERLPVPARNADLQAASEQSEISCRKGTGVTIVIASSDHSRHSRTKMQC